MIRNHIFNIQNFKIYLLVLANKFKKGCVENHFSELLFSHEVHLFFVCFFSVFRTVLYEKELKHIIHDIEKERDFEILEMETNKGHIHPLFKSKQKVSTLAIILKLEL